MHFERRWYGIGLGALIALAGCGQPEGVPELPGAAGETSRGGVQPGAALEDELEAARTRILARADSVSETLGSVRGLAGSEVADLRRDVNARQVATARALGTRPGNEDQVQRLISAGRLVELEDSTELWVVRELDYSVPFVTPDTRAMLVEIGERFHARLDSLGLPRYRLDITSVLRTPATQAALRRRNANAANGVSAHEFGTTVDVAHARFAAPAELVADLPSHPEHGSAMRVVEAVVLEWVAREKVSGLQGELGRVLQEMRAEGKLRVMMERQQAVYHMTVATRFPGSATAE